MRNLGFIPVRGGSKRLPRKNLMDLGGKSITHRAIDVALESKMFTDIILSTDDDEIIEHCKEYEKNGQIIIDRRDSSLAQDTSTVLQVVVELINRLTVQNKIYDTFTIMLATCPFKLSSHIQDGFKLLDSDADAVVSVTEYDFPWEMSLLLDEKSNMTTAIHPSALVIGNTRSQDRKKVFHPNGAFYIGKWESILRDENFFKGNMKGYPMDEKYSQDIDTQKDMKIARYIVKKRLI